MHRNGESILVGILLKCRVIRDFINMPFINMPLTHAHRCLAHKWTRRQTRARSAPREAPPRDGASPGADLARVWSTCGLGSGERE